MLNSHPHEFYQALLDRNSEYEGVFFVGVKSTGIFCRPTCPAKKPKFEHCEFFATAQEALLASYRPCKRCQPLSHPDQMSDVLQHLIDAVEADPERRWKDQDFRELGIDVSTARRQFKKRFGMTFIAYARARRMGIAMKHIKGGGAVIDAQLAAGYESSSGFRDAFARVMGDAPTKVTTVLHATWIDSPLGPIIAIADDQALYLLEFVDRRGLELEIERLRRRTKCGIVPGKTAPIESIEKELEQYFAGSLTTFLTPLHFLGSSFQKHVWEALKQISYGETTSYSRLAKQLGYPTAHRAVARANGANQIAIVVPCHRVIGLDGHLTGYGGGIARKKWLIEHEKMNSCSSIIMQDHDKNATYT